MNINQETTQCSFYFFHQMHLQEFRQHLTQIDELSFQLPDGKSIPHHFHITEVALVDKTYIDCGGVHRHEQVITLQIRVAGDTQHRLAPEKLLKIIDHSRSFIDNDLLPIQAEYQGLTIGRYDILFAGNKFVLQTLFTTCLAQNACGISPNQLPKNSSSSCCDDGCC